MRRERSSSASPRGVVGVEQSIRSLPGVHALPGTAECFLFLGDSVHCDNVPRTPSALAGVRPLRQKLTQGGVLEGTHGRERFALFRKMHPSWRRPVCVGQRPSRPVRVRGSRLQGLLMRHFCTSRCILLAREQGVARASVSAAVCISSFRRNGYAAVCMGVLSARAHCWPVRFWRYCLGGGWCCEDLLCCLSRPVCGGLGHGTTSGVERRAAL